MPTEDRAARVAAKAKAFLEFARRKNLDYSEEEARLDAESAVLTEEVQAEAQAEVPWQPR
jgi:hypothetical protein